ncbi:protoheme IX farnesyltransferase [Gemmatimonadota bacterium]
MTGFGRLKVLSELTRMRLSLFVAMSAATGFAVATYRLTWGILVPSLGCVLLAAGCSMLNQYQERKLDAVMSRTRARPIPSGAVVPLHALALAIVLIVMALIVLAVGCGLLATLFGLSALVLYNGVYTWMKRRSAFAAVPGAFIGALGPAIGWVAGGGAVSSPTLLALATVFFLWQVPHFWLLSLNYPADYTEAGYPSAVTRMGKDRLYRVGLVWITCTAVATLALPLFGLLSSVALYLVLCAAAALLGGVLVRTAWRPALASVRYRVSFAGVNVFVLVTMILLIVESGL